MRLGMLGLISASRNSPATRRRTLSTWFLNDSQRWRTTSSHNSYESPKVALPISASHQFGCRIVGGPSWEALKAGARPPFPRCQNCRVAPRLGTPCVRKTIAGRRWCCLSRLLLIFPRIPNSIRVSSAARVPHAASRKNEITTSVHRSSMRGREEAQDFVNCLVAAKASDAFPILRRSAHLAWQRSWMRMLAISLLKVGPLTWLICSW